MAGSSPTASSHCRVRRSSWQIIAYSPGVGWATGTAALHTGNAAGANQAAQLARLMQRLNLARAHIVGHSSGGLIALQFALDYPAATQSLVLLEPALSIPGIANPGIAQAVRIYQSGDRAGAMDAFMRAVAGSGWREHVEREIPLGFSQAIADAPAFFDRNYRPCAPGNSAKPRRGECAFPRSQSSGGNSHKVSANWPTRQAFLMKHLPDVEAYVLEGLLSYARAPGCAHPRGTHHAIFRKSSVSRALSDAASPRSSWRHRRATRCRACRRALSAARAPAAPASASCAARARSSPSARGRPRSDRGCRIRSAPRHRRRPG